MASEFGKFHMKEIKLKKAQTERPNRGVADYTAIAMFEFYTQMI